MSFRLRLLFPSFGKDNKLHLNSLNGLCCCLFVEIQRSWILRWNTRAINHHPWTVSRSQEQYPIVIDWERCNVQGSAKVARTSRAPVPSGVLHFVNQKKCQPMLFVICRKNIPQSKSSYFLCPNRTLHQSGLNQVF